MSTTQLFFGLIGILVLLFGLALVQPHFTKKPISIDDFKHALAQLLPHYDLFIKHGTHSRIIISLNGTQKAIIVMDTPKAQYVMGGLPIFTTNKPAHLTTIAQKIQQDITIN